MGYVAQLVSALVCGTSLCQFEPDRTHFLLTQE